MNIKNSLSEEQEKIVLDPAHVKQIIAGAGCGKTFTIIEAIYKCFLDGLKPENLLLITFTRKAAGEMKERLEKKITRSGLNLDMNLAKVGTFHSIALSLLKQYFPERIKGYRIIADEEESKIIHELASPYKARLMGIPVDLFLKSKKLPGDFLELRNQIMDDYKNLKDKSKLIDFNDMLDIWDTSISELKKTETDEGRKLLKQFTSHFQLAVVDEFQDSGDKEMKFLQHVEAPNVIIVGDDWQSIYGFKGGDLEYSYNFKKYYPDVKRFYLTTNYRSSPQIVKASTQIIRHSRKLIRKKLTAYNAKGPKPVFFIVPSKKLYTPVLDRLFYYFSGENSRESVAFLTRTNRQVTFLENQFQTHACYALLKDRLQFLTIHQSKGLEYHTVVVYPLDANSLPHPSGHVDEELRLLYVALSRAERRLLVIGITGIGESQFQKYFGIRTRRRFIERPEQVGKVLGRHWK